MDLFCNFANNRINSLSVFILIFQKYKAHVTVIKMTFMTPSLKYDVIRINAFYIHVLMLNMNYL